MVFAFTLVDPENRFRGHKFWFEVLYAAAEETLIVVRGTHWVVEGA